MATQYPPEELRRMLSGNPGRLSIKVSIPPLLRPDTWTLWREQSKHSKHRTEHEHWQTDTLAKWCLAILKLKTLVLLGI